MHVCCAHISGVARLKEVLDLLVDILAYGKEWNKREGISGISATGGATGRGDRRVETEG